MEHVKEELLSKIQTLIKDISESSCRRFGDCFYILKESPIIVSNENKKELLDQQQKLFNSTSAVIHFLDFFEITLQNWDGNQESVLNDMNLQYCSRNFNESILIKEWLNDAETIENTIAICFEEIKKLHT